MQAEREIKTPIGMLTLCGNEQSLCALRFGASGGRRDETHLLLQAEEELEEYFAGRRRAFSVPLSLKGTAFQLRVWRALQQIAYGETVSYGEIARRIGKSGAARAVGMANHVNPLPIFVPCHRVIGADGKLTGYAGGLDIKRILLEMEREHVEV